MKNTIQVTRDGQFHVIQIFENKEEMIKRFYETREAAVQLDARIQDLEKEHAMATQAITEMKESREQLAEFLKMAGEAIDSYK